MHSLLGAFSCALRCEHLIISPRSSCISSHFEPNTMALDRSNTYLMFLLVPWLACQSILDSVRTGVLCSPVFDNSPLGHNALDLDALVFSRCGGRYQPSARNLIYRYRARLYWHDVLAKVTVISLTAEGVPVICQGIDRYALP